MPSIQGAGFRTLAGVFPQRSIREVQILRLASLAQDDNIGSIVMTDDEQAIRDVIAMWLRASGDGDAATVLSLMADDVVFLVAGREPFGKQAFAESFSALAPYRMEATSDVREVCVSGDWAHSWTHLVVSMTPKSGGATVRRSGQTLSVFQRLSDGRWVLARDANLLTLES
jgi:uncharacterized protein (TIGR02246 family)